MEMGSKFDINFVSLLNSAAATCIDYSRYIYKLYFLEALENLGIQTSTE